MGTKKNIILTGGQLYNKGAQSMTFNVINKLKSIYPDKEIYLMSKDYERTIKEKEIYNFNFLPNRTKSYINLCYGKNIYRDSVIQQEVRDIDAILKNGFINIDISGLKFTSQMSKKLNADFLLQRKLMEKYNIKQYIFPQSFGPFDYPQPWKIMFNQYAKMRLKKVEIIMCREDEGYNNLKEITNTNLVRTYDSVFYGDDYKEENIFSSEVTIKEFNILDNSVGIVPNEKLVKFNKSNNIEKIYQDIIEILLKKNKNVYIFRHSTEDLNFCRKIKAIFPNDERVVLIEDDLNCIELKKLIKQFQFIVGSRYHSIVHAYSVGVPALILGWAYKYKELAKAFNQSNYIFDITGDMNVHLLHNSLEMMNNNYAEESFYINNKVSEIREVDIFQLIK